MQNWYYIHGLKDWTKKSIFGRFSPQISISLNHDYYTVPLYPYGYIVTIIDPKCIVSSFDTDVSSELNSFGNKVFSRLTKDKWFKDYYDDLDNLIRNTKHGSHNEIWIRSCHVKIIGIYINKENVPGLKSFKKAARKRNFIVPLFS